MSRKFISLLLALTLIIGLVPVFASAAKDTQEVTLEISVELYNDKDKKTRVSEEVDAFITKLNQILEDKYSNTYQVGVEKTITVDEKTKVSDLFDDSSVNGLSIPDGFYFMGVADKYELKTGVTNQVILIFNRGGSRDLTVKKEWCCEKHADKVTFVITGPGDGYNKDGGITITLNGTEKTPWTYIDYPKSDGESSAYGYYEVTELSITPPENHNIAGTSWKGSDNKPKNFTNLFDHNSAYDDLIQSGWTNMRTGTRTVEVPVTAKECSTAYFANLDPSSPDPSVDEPEGKIEKTASATTVKAGDTYYYTITASNTGTAVWQNVVATDTLPGVLTYVDFTDASDGVTVTDNNGKLTIDFGDIGIGKEKSVKINVTVSDSVTAGDTISNEVTATSDNHVKVQDDVDVKVVPKEEVPAPLGTITKTASSTVKAGDTYSYTITAKNNGTAIWENVVATDTLPGDLTYEGFTSSDDVTVTDDSGKLTINFGNIGIGAEKSVTINVKVSSTAAAGNTIHNVVTAKSSNQEEVSDYADTEVVPDSAPSLTLMGTKNLTGRTLREGEFRFAVADSQGNRVVTGTNSASGIITFPAIYYTAAGTYDYTVSEVRGSLSGITYDRTTYYVAVTVTDNSGTLEITKVTVDGATVTVTNGSMTSRTAIVFNNRYTSSSSGTTTTPSRSTSSSSSSSSSSSPSLPSTAITEVTVPTGSAPSVAPQTEISDENVPLGDRPAPVGPQTGQDLPLKVLFVLFLLGTAVLTTTLIKGLRYGKKNN